MKITPTPFLVVLSAVLGIGALAWLFIYLPYGNSTESAQENLDAAAARSREKEARIQAFEERKKNFERQAEELQQNRMQSWNERQARQRRLEQEREVQKNQNQ